MNIPLHTLENAPEAARATLGQVREAYGFIPNLIATLAESPLGVAAYHQLSGLIQSEASLTAQEQQIVMLAVSFENGCEYCMAAHSAVAATARVSPAIIEGLRSGSALPDPKTAVLVKLARAIVRERGWVGEELVEEFLGAGYTRAQVIEVIVITALKTISNYTNHMAGTPLDAAFASQKWERPGSNPTSHGGPASACCNP